MGYRILIVDDHPLISWAMEKLVEQQPDLEVCGTAKSVNGCLALLESTRPDLIMLDLLLEDGSGTEIIEWIRQSGLSTRVLVSSMCEDPRKVSEIVRLGVSGFLDKTQPMETVLEGIRSVLNGQHVISPRIQEICVQAMRLGVDNDGPWKAIQELSPRESEIFRMMGKNLNPSEIAQELGIAIKTVHTHRQNIRQKLGLRSMSELYGKAALFVTNLA